MSYLRRAFVRPRLIVGGLLMFFTFDKHVWQIRRENGWC